VVKTLLALGYVTGDEMKDLRALWKLRNDVMHGFEPRSELKDAEIDRLLKIAERLVRSSARRG
jgi:uncharacterized protein YutE (UPF0331/DUF86 family)